MSKIARLVDLSNVTQSKYFLKSFKYFEILNKLLKKKKSCTGTCPKQLFLGPIL